MKENNKTLDTIDALLGGIQQVEAPPFLFTKIQAQLDSQQQDRLSVAWVWAVAAAVALLFAINLWSIQHHSYSTLDASTVVEEMNLIPDNSLYN